MKVKKVSIFIKSQKQIEGNMDDKDDQKPLSRGALRKRCAENMQQIHRRTPMSKCNFKKAMVYVVCHTGTGNY